MVKEERERETRMTFSVRAVEKNYLSFILNKISIHCTPSSSLGPHFFGERVFFGRIVVVVVQGACVFVLERFLC